MAFDEFLQSNRKAVGRAMEKRLERKLSREGFLSCCGAQQYGVDSLQSAQESVNAPIWDLLDRGGKRWRPALLLLTAQAFGADPFKLLDLSTIPEIVHNGTLMVDDVEDDSELRRGKPCIHKSYGVDVAVNAGSAMYFLPLTALDGLAGKYPDKTLLQAYRIYAEELRAVSYGQGIDIWWHKGNGGEVSEGQYLQMVALKTGALARMAARLGALFAGASEKDMRLAGEFAEAIGVAFQVQDDVLNLTAGSEYGKEIGGDISEGKRTLITAHALSHATPADRKKLLAILDAKTKDAAKIRQATAILESAGSIGYAKARSREIVKSAWRRFSSVLPASKAKTLLSQLADYLVEREI
ncbi:MAG: polyprenyl synthetase family protein [Candidatus Micrarchaeota archaeon]